MIYNTLTQTDQVEIHRIPLAAWIVLLILNGGLLGLGNPRLWVRLLLLLLVVLLGILHLWLLLLLWGWYINLLLRLLLLCELLCIHLTLLLGLLFDKEVVVGSLKRL